LEKYRKSFINYLLENYLIESLSDQHCEIKKYSIFNILVLTLASNFDKIAFVFFILNFLMNANLLALVYPISIFFYALIENPFPLRSNNKNDFFFFFKKKIVIFK